MIYFFRLPYTSATFDTKNVGTTKAVSVGGISISGTDATNYTFSDTASTTADITARALVVSAAGVNKTYDGTTVATVTLSDDRVAGDVFSDSYVTATFNTRNVGTSKTVSVSGITISGTDAGNYTFNTTASTMADITARNLTVSATGVNKVYDAGTVATVTLSDNRVSGDTVSESFTSASFADKNVGTGKSVSVSGVSIGGTDAINYALQNTTASTTADITARALVVAAHGVNRVYDGTIATTVTLSDDKLSGDDVADHYSSASFADKNVGTGKTVSVGGISITGADAGNYSVNTTTSTTADITALAITGSITAAGKVYDATTAATITSRTLAGQVSGDDVNYVGGTATFSDKNVGASKTVIATGLLLSGTDAGNYSVNDTATTTANITPLAITGHISADSKVYDSTATANIHDRTLSGVISGDVVSYVGGTASFSDKNVGSGKTVTGTGLGLSGTDAGNYTVNDTATAIANISARALHVSATGVNKVYDGTTAATVTLSDNRVSGDSVTTSYTSAVFNIKNVGVGKSVSVSGISISGADAGNYSFNPTATTTANITARTLVITAQTNTKTYDGTRSPIAPPTTSGVQVGDTVTGLAETYDTRNVGTGKTLSVSAYTVNDGNSGNNYSVTLFTDNTGVITARALTISATGVNKAYDGTAAATVTLSDNRVSGDVFTDSYVSASFANKNVGSGKTVSVSGISITGTDAGNYTFNTIASTAANITARSLTITAATNTKTYDGNTSAAAAPTTSGLQGSDTATGLSETYDNSNVGPGKTLSVVSYTIIDGNGGNNYAVSTVADHTGSIVYASTGTCYGGPGHTILQPINTDGTSVNKQGSTVPAKVRVCDANGNSIGTPGVVSSFVLYQIFNGTLEPVINEAVDSTTPDTAFRWSSTDQQWIFNISTKSLSKNQTYIYHINLNDGSTIQFQFGLK